MYTLFQTLWGRVISVHRIHNDTLPDTIENNSILPEENMAEHVEQRDGKPTKKHFDQGQVLQSPII